MQTDKDIEKVVRAKAIADGQFAIAHSILTLAAELRTFQQNMTFGNFEHQGNRTPGIGEKIAMELTDIQQHIGDIAESMRPRD